MHHYPVHRLAVAEEEGGASNKVFVALLHAIKKEATVILILFNII